MTHSGDRWRGVLATAVALVAVVAYVALNQQRDAPAAPPVARPADPTPTSTPVPLASPNSDAVDVTTFPEDAGAGGRSVVLALGENLLPRVGRALPVRPVWAVPKVTPAAFAVDRGVVYVASDELRAFRLSDGRLLWSTGDPIGDGLAADGGVVLGLDGPEVVRAIAPYNFDIAVDRRSGALLHLGREGERPAPRRTFPPPDLDGPGVEDNDVVGRSSTGRITWRVRVDRPVIDPMAPVRAGRLQVLVTSGGSLVVLADR